MTVIVQISDMHFGTEVPKIVEAAVESIAAIKPDIIVLSGDITQRARPSQFAAAKSFMDGLTASVKLVIPGNHDIPLYDIFTRLIAPYRNYVKVFGKREDSWRGKGIGILCYDATNPLRHTRGEVPRKKLLRRLQAFERQLGEGELLIACAHQPLVTAWEKDIPETLIGREVSAQLWSENNVDLVMSGHVHVPLITTTRKYFPNLPRHFILCGAGTAISSRVRPGAPNSFNLVKSSSPDAISVTLHAFDGVRFVPDVPLQFHLVGDGWAQTE